MTLKRFEKTDAQLRSGTCKCGASIVTHGRRGTPKTMCLDCQEEARLAAKRAQRLKKKQAGASA